MSHRRFEGFQLPTLIDPLVVETALTSLIDDPPADAVDLALKGSEILSRTLGHQTSDFAVLIGAQKTERARDTVRSYYLLQQQKRQWELDQIKILLAGGKKEAGYLITSYAGITETIGRLEEALTKDADYAKAIGYPKAAQIQSVLEPNEVFLTLVPASGVRPSVPPYQALIRMPNQATAAASAARATPPAARIIRTSAFGDPTCCAIPITGCSPCAADCTGSPTVAMMRDFANEEVTAATLSRPGLDQSALTG